MKKLIFGLIIIAGAIIISCADSAKKEFEKSVKIFLTDFQNKLKGNDDQIFKLFATNQNKNEILKAIRILQNGDSIVKANILFDSAQSSWEDSYLKVEIPVKLISKNEPEEKSSFAFQLFRREGKFYIGRLVAEKLYNRYFVLKNQNAAILARLMADIKIYYDRAQELQKNYDTIVWYAHHKNMTYYYAVNGQYNFDSLKKEKPQDFKMGLIDETGKVIVPVAFDLIGNPSINLPEALEVRKNGKIGYYSLEGKEIVPAIYEWLIPYEEKEAIALVKKDSTTYGWLDKSFTYHEKFPSAIAEQSVKEFSYLTDNTFSFGAEYNDLIRILYPFSEDFQYRGAGMIIPPSYFVTVGLFPRVDEGFLIKSNDSLRSFQYGTEFTETKSRKPFSISEKMDAFISDFKSRFVGGREEFYTGHKIVLLDKKSNPIASVHAYGDHDFQFKRLKEDLFESKAQFNYWGPSEFFEENIPDYSYFKFENNVLTPIEINRVFDFTQIIKIDSSYLSGDFDTHDYVNNVKGKSTFLSLQTLQYMRDEILDSYGFVFENQEKNQLFNYQRKDLPEITSYEEVYSKASEIDKYNLDFLNRLIGSTPAESNL